MALLYTLSDNADWLAVCCCVHKFNEWMQCGGESGVVAVVAWAIWLHTHQCVCLVWCGVN